MLSARPVYFYHDDYLESLPTRTVFHSPPPVIFRVPDDESFVLDISVSSSPPETKPIPKKNYLEKFTPAEIDELIEKFKTLGLQTKSDLENFFYRNRHSLYLFAGIYFTAVFINVGYVPFIVQVGIQAITTAAQFFKPSADVPDVVGKALGVPIGFLDVAQYMISFDLMKEATKALLAYRKWRQIPISQRAKDFAAWAIKNKYLTLCTLTFEAILLFFNSESMMTVIIGYSDYLSIWSTVLLSMIALTFGNLYMSEYSREDAIKGREFFNDKTIAWLYEETLRLNPAVLQPILGGIVSSGMTAYPVFDYIGLETGALYNFNPSANLIFAYASSVVAFIRNMYVYYPIPFKRFLIEPRENLLSLVEQLEKLQEEKKPTEEKQLSHAAKLIFRENVAKSYEEKALQEFKNFGLLKKEKEDYYQFLAILATGGALTGLCFTNPSVPTFLITSGVLFIAAVDAKSKINRAKTLVACEKVQQDINLLERKQPEEEIQNLPSSKTRHRLANGTAVLFSAGGALASLLSLMGTLDTSDHSLKLFFFVLAIYQFMTSWIFNVRKIKKTLNTPGSFFNPRKPVPQEHLQITSVDANHTSEPVAPRLGNSLCEEH